MFAQDQAFSPNELGSTESFIQSTIKLAASSLRVNRSVSAAEVQRIVDILDAGELDGAIERNAPVRAQKLESRNFADVTPYSDKDWLARHGDGV
jgi:hypothetical protein